MHKKKSFCSDCKNLGELKFKGKTVCRNICEKGYKCKNQTSFPTRKTYNFPNGKSVDFIGNPLLSRPYCENFEPREKAKKVYNGEPVL